MEVRVARRLMWCDIQPREPADWWLNTSDNISFNYRYSTFEKRTAHRGYNSESTEQTKKKHSAIQPTPSVWLWKQYNAKMPWKEKYQHENILSHISLETSWVSNHYNSRIRWWSSSWAAPLQTEKLHVRMLPLHAQKITMSGKKDSRVDFCWLSWECFTDLFVYRISPTCNPWILKWYSPEKVPSSDSLALP